MIVRRAGAWLGSIALIVGIAAPYAVAKDDSEKAPNPETAAPLDRNVPRHHEINKRAREGSVEVIFIGDSITQGWEGAGQGVWKKRYERRKAMNAGIGGDRTQHILWRLDNG